MTEHTTFDPAAAGEPLVHLDYQHVLDALADPVVATDASNRIIYVNQATEKLLGWPAEELIGKPLVTIMPARFRELHLARFNRYVISRVPRIIGRPIRLPALHRDGTEIDIELVLSALSTPDADPLIVATLRDLRDRLELERQLGETEEAEQRFAFLAEASRVLAASLDYQTTLTTVARLVVPHLAVWCVVDILEDDETVRRLEVAHVDPAKMELARELQHRYPPDFSEESQLMQVLRSGEPFLMPEIPQDRLLAAARDEEHGKILQELGLRSYMVVPLVARQRSLGAISFVAAESDRRYGPDDLVLAEDLARRAAMAVDNARLYREVQEAIRTRDEFLSSISHDLKTPLTTLKGQAQLIQRRLARVDTEESERAVEGLENIVTAASKMNRLIDDLLDVAHLRVGRPLDLRREPTDLVALVQRVAEEQPQLTQRHTIRVESSIPTLVGDWDTARLERVVSNLLSNAVKYSPDGGEITVTVWQEKDEGAFYAVLQVEDRGVGIPAEDLPNIFERFHRGANVAGRIAGTGIGLAGAT